eukprot:gene721-8973_t
MKQDIKEKISNYQKFDSEGNYSFFPGYTYISFLDTKESKQWKIWYDELKSIIPCTYQILPFNSLHMTVRNLVTVNHFKSEKDPHAAFENFFNKHKQEFYHLIHEENEFITSKFHGNVTNNNLYFDMSIGIEIQFNQDEMKILQEKSKYKEDLFDKEIQKSMKKIF